MNEGRRQLAAIMFTDIVGYTALMSKDELKTLQLLQQQRDIMKPLIKQYNEMKRLFAGKGGLGAAMQGLAGMMQGGQPAVPSEAPEERARKLRAERERKRRERRKKKKQQRKQKKRR